jgi:hypothetical protein
MPYLIDASNLLGAMRVDRHGDESKRRLVTLLAGFARAKKTRVTCIFDGPEPASFARHLGAVTIGFSGSRPADDLIVERAAHGRSRSFPPRPSSASWNRRRQAGRASPPTTGLLIFPTTVTG